MRIALVHDYLNQWGGAERVLLELHRLFPEAPIYTSIWDRQRLHAFASAQIRTSFLDRMPSARRNHQLYLLLYPFVFSRLKLDCDIVISSSSAFAKSVSASRGSVHICYCHSPMRFAWNFRDYVAGEALPLPLVAALSLIMPMLRRWDQRTAERVDKFIANSRTVAERIRRYYGREATVVHPPVDVGEYRLGLEEGHYFLIVSRLVPYKRLDVAIDAFNRLGWPLVVVGEGRYSVALRRMARANVVFLGRVDEAALKDLYCRAKALIFPGEEDFGMAPVEAMASGRPVIAFAKGGALETVAEGITGMFFQHQSPDALIEVLLSFNPRDYDPRLIRSHALKFDTKVFRQKILEEVTTAVGHDSGLEVPATWS
jgi:glycosyltransferase involved in cell wall biosynthesis